MDSLANSAIVTTQLWQCSPRYICFPALICPLGGNIEYMHLILKQSHRTWVYGSECQNETVPQGPIHSECLGWNQPSESAKLMTECGSLRTPQRQEPLRGWGWARLFATFHLYLTPNLTETHHKEGCALKHMDIQFPYCFQTFWFILFLWQMFI